MIKAYVIRKKGDDLAERLSDETVASAKSFGIEVEKFDGVFGSEIQEKLDYYKLFPFQLNGNETTLTKGQGTKGCFLSHYKLWKRCITLDENILIFEHDAVMIRALEPAYLKDFVDVLHLDPYSRDPTSKDKLEKNRFRRNRLSYEKLLYSTNNVVSKRFTGYGQVGLKTVGLIKNGFIRGTHAYIISPRGAKRLIVAIKKFGYLASDVQLNLNFVDVMATYPSLARVNSFCCDQEKWAQYSTASGVANEQ